MSTTKIGRFNIPDHAVEKPIGINDDGTYIYPKNITDGFVAPVTTMSLKLKEHKIKMAMVRIDMEPDFELGVFGYLGRFTKSQVMKHIGDETPLGQIFTNLEIDYSQYFTNQLSGTENEKITAPPPPLTSNFIPIAPEFIPSLRSKVVFCENTLDPITYTGAYYRIANVHPVFKSQGYEVISLEGVYDSINYFNLYASDPNVVFISGIGHGDDTTYSGYLNSTILQVGLINPATVNGKILHFLSCDTGSLNGSANGPFGPLPIPGHGLGPSTVKNGCKAYAGYAEEYLINFNDNQAEIFWGCDSTFDISMAMGKTTEQAVADTLNAYSDAVDLFPNTITASTLLYDRSIFNSPLTGPEWGSKTAKIRL